MGKRASGVEDQLVALMGGASKQAVQLQEDPRKWLDSRIRTLMTPITHDERFTIVSHNTIEFQRKSVVNKRYIEFVNEIKRLGIDEATGKQKTNRQYGRRIRWDIETMAAFLDISYNEQDTLFTVFSKYLKRMADKMDEVLSENAPQKMTYELMEVILEKKWISRCPNKPYPKKRLEESGYWEYQKMRENY